MKISHESPLCLLDRSRSYNDYDYALVHLFETEPTYLQFFKHSLAQGRTVLLDNSIFELGTAFNPSEYAYWIEELRPTEYIIPDVLEDTLGTMDNALDWKEKYSDLPGKTIGVVQGKSYEDLVQCYDYLDNIIGVDKIAISFDYSYYLEVCPHPNKWMGYALGRVQTLTRLLNDGVINTKKPHHLLGCALPIEFMFYRQGFEWLESLDTSNPIVHALLDFGYEPGGLDAKKSIKLIELLNTPEPSVATMHTIKHNIQYFRSYVHGYR
jgi:nitrate reductase NapAB chaperone NapD